MTTKVVIIGNALAAEIVYGVLSRDKRIDVVAFSVHEQFIKEKELYNLPVIPLETLTRHYSPDNYQVVMAVGYSNLNQNREQLFHLVESDGYTVMTYIHPTSTILSENIEPGVFIMPGVVIEPHATIEKNAVIWSNTTIAHHVSIQAHCWVASNCVVAGEALVGRNTFLGVNVTVVNKIAIGNYNIIGAGSLVTKDTENNSVLLARSAEKHRFDSHNYVRLSQF